MTYLVMFHWGWLLGSLLIGLAMGWIAVVHRGPAVSIVQARWLGVLAIVLVALAASRIVPGRAGYWLDLGLMMFVPYLAASGRVEPLLNPGWTLNVEMVFYGVFALALLISRRYRMISVPPSPDWLDDMLPLARTNPARPVGAR